MSKEKLEENIRIFYNQMDERLESLSPKEQQQYLEGLVHAFDSISRYGNLKDLTPLEQQNFIGSLKSWAYSKTYHLDLDPEKYMRGLIESDGGFVAKAYKIAAELQLDLGIPIDSKDQHNIFNVNAVAAIEAIEREEKAEEE